MKSVFFPISLVLAAFLIGNIYFNNLSAGRYDGIAKQNAFLTSQIKENWNAAFDQGYRQGVIDVFYRKSLYVIEDVPDSNGKVEMWRRDCSLPVSTPVPLAAEATKHKNK